MFDRLAQKLAPPSTASALLPRTGIMTRLEQARCYRLVLLRAPAGYGKTSVLRLLHADWRSRGAAVGWLTFDSADNDPARMLLSLRAALHGEHPQPDAPVRSLKQARITHLFLDEVDRLDAAAIRLLLSIATEILAPGLHIFLAGRSLHQVSVANLKVRKVLCEFNLEQLRFAPDETASYLRQSALYLDERELAWLREQTEGWPAAVELLVLAWRRIQGGSAAGLPCLHGSELSDYLAAEVLQAQPEDIQAFLKATAPLASFSAELADAVRGAGDSAQLIARLRLAGLPIHPLGDQWYRYHPLFAQHIARHHAGRQQAPGSSAARAAAWLLGQGRGLEAFDYYIMAGDHEGAADALETLAGALRASGQFPSLLLCCDQLPEALLRRRPNITRNLVVALSYSTRLADAARWLGYFREQSTLPDADPAYGDALRAYEPVLAFQLGDVDSAIRLAELHWPDQQHANPHERGVLATVLAYSYLVRGMLPQAAGMLITARRICAESGNISNTAVVIFVQAYLDAVEGRLDICLQQLASIDAILHQHSDTIAPTFHYSYSAALLLMVLYERNLMDALADRMKVARGLAGISLHWDTFSAALVIQTRMWALQHGTASAKRWLEGEIMKIGGNRPPQVAAALEGELSRLAVLGNSRSAIAAYAAQLALPSGAPAAWIFPSQEIDGAGIAQARLDTSAGRPEAAVAQLRPLLSHATATGRLWRAAKLRVLLALALEQTGQEDEALAQLALAAEQAAKSGLVRTFLDEGTGVTLLLRKLQARPRSLSPAAADHLRLLLDYATGADGVHQPADGLTRTELSLLALVAEGRSNRDVASSLGLSVNTVKWHLAQIFSKLDVHNRGQAVHRARQAGLLAAAAPARPSGPS
jgi:LuxR family maltose regulon positive regulatory protein